MCGLDSGYRKSLVNLLVVPKIASQDGRVTLHKWYATGIHRMNAMYRDIAEATSY
jgi:hypothetical protein